MAENLLQTIGIEGKLPTFSFTLVDRKERGTLFFEFENYRRHKSVGSIQTVFDMNDLAYRSLQVIDPELIFCPDFPDDLLPEEQNIAAGDLKSAEQVKKKIITWGVVRKEPGTVGGPPFRGTQEIKPRNREFVAIFENDIKKYIGPNAAPSFIAKYGKLMKFVEIKGQVFDNLVQYNIWSKSNYEVEQMCDWFEEYMLTYTGMFREAGIVEMVFWNRIRDDTIIQIKNGYHVRSLLYYIRTEKLNLNTILPIERIDLDVYVQDVSKKLELMNLEDITIENVYSKIVDKWVNKNKFFEELNNG